MLGYPTYQTTAQTQQTTAQMPYQPVQPAYQAAQYFPQPQGSIYMINSPNDIANVPVGAGISAAICLGEGLMYLKTVQNGSTAIVTYRISPDAAPQQSQAQSTQTAPPPQATTPSQNEKLIEALEGFNRRLQAIETNFVSAPVAQPPVAQPAQPAAAQPATNTSQRGTSEWQL